MFDVKLGTSFSPKCLLPKLICSYRLITAIFYGKFPIHVEKKELTDCLENNMPHSDLLTTKFDRETAKWRRRIAIELQMYQEGFEQ